MARFVAGAVFGAALMLVGGAALGLHAQDPQTDVWPISAAAAAGVDPVELAGAANTVGVDAWVYARSEGLLERAPVLPAVSARSVWDRLAACEATGNWHANTGNGFAGGLQFTPATWRAYGGVGSPAQASREAQIVVAERVLVAQGWKAWPACSRVLGLR